ncbi:transposase [Edwardsiella ictaluri]|uniref:transposase n=1 Tax=Edwardsiella ictaluri TaxID=67780 RepID=UPI0037837868
MLYVQRIGKIPGIGPVTATALIATIGNASNFENSRQLAAWLGLVPRQHSSGGKQVLLGISKRGDVYLRTLLIHEPGLCCSRSNVNRMLYRDGPVGYWPPNNNIASSSIG